MFKSHEYIEKLEELNDIYLNQANDNGTRNIFINNLLDFKDLVKRHFDLRDDYDKLLAEKNILKTIADALLSGKDKAYIPVSDLEKIKENDLEKIKENDPINPTYYNDTKITPFDVIDDWGLDFYLGSAMKYIKRAGKKEGNSTVQDLLKVKRYIEKEIELVDAEVNK